MSPTHSKPISPANPDTHSSSDRPSRRKAKQQRSAGASAPLKLWQRVLPISLLGSLLMFAAQPPLDLWPLAWIAPIPWLMLVRLKELPGARPYMKLWVAGFVYWLLAIHWLRLPHPATHLGWLALAFYLGFYLPVFVAVTRTAMRKLRCPLIAAAPIVWTGLELARGYLLTGFLMGAVGHTQYRWTQLIQVSDITGGYGIDFLILFVAAGLTSMWSFSHRRLTLWPAAPITVALAAVLGYGYYRTSGDYLRAGPKVALIQGSIPSEFKSDPEREQQIMSHYFELSQRAVKENRDLDLIVWPETMFRSPLITIEGNVEPEPDSDLSSEQLTNLLESVDRRSRSAMAQMTDHFGAPMLLGVDIFEYSGSKRKSYNSAVFVNRQGEVVGRYDKMHRVMFGEFIPFGEMMPWLYDGLTPLTGGIQAGAGPTSVKIADTGFAPNICYETVIPHTIRAHVRGLEREGKAPDVLVNLTNDGWFRGSSELDQHLACGVFRAVETRKPLIIAANTGLSASIDSDGRVLQLGPRMQADVLIADVQLDSRPSLYMRLGDIFAGFCLALTIVFASSGLIRRKRLAVDRDLSSTVDATGPAAG